MTPRTDVVRAEGLALELAGWATAQLLRAARPGADPGPPVEAKQHPADLVTALDRDIEARVRAELAVHFPGHAVRGEEGGGPLSTPGRPLWLVDPVDGTTNLARGLGWCAFALALLDGDGSPLVGVVADPWRGETFSAVRHHGARCNGVPVRVRDATTLAGHLVLTELAAHRPWPGMGGLMAALAADYCTVRVMGSTALSLAQVAAGRAAAAVLGSDDPLDTAAGRLIAAEAGALVTTHPQQGSAGTTLVAAAPGVADAVRRAAGAPGAG